jgi:negative modulator of initiation of replication
MPEDPQRTVQLDADVYDALLKRLQSFDEGVNGVLRRILNLPANSSVSMKFKTPSRAAAGGPIEGPSLHPQGSTVIGTSIRGGDTVAAKEPTPSEQHFHTSLGFDISDKSHFSALPPIVAFVKGPQFQSLTKGLDRYLALLSWIHNRHPDRFGEIQELPFGGRTYFSDNPDDITKSRGVTAKRIPKTEYFSMATLSNDTKRKIISQTLQYFGYPIEEVKMVLGEMPASESRLIS